MNHKVNNVQQLYDDAMGLYNKVVLQSADNIIGDLNQAINILKSSWEGKDAGIQINNVVEVHNAMVFIRNVLAELAKDSSAIAVNYRQIQNANRANLDSLAPLTTNIKNGIEPYVDNRDTINITAEAMNGKNRLDAANNAIDGFISEVRRYYDVIMENWQMGPGRDKTEQAFGDFMSKSNNYKKILEEVSQSITNALKNYTI